MTQYVLAQVDESVDAAYLTLGSLGLIDEKDTVNKVSFSDDCVPKVTTPDNLIEIYSQVEKEDDLLVVINGSGNYHHHTYGFCRGIFEQDETDYTLVHYDKHADASPFQPDIDYGSHNAHLVRDSPYMKKAILIGPDSMVGDSAWFDKNIVDSVEVFPYTKKGAIFVLMDHQPDLDAESVRFEEHSRNLYINWHTIKDLGIESVTEKAINRTQTDNVYISVDMDVLKREYAATNWGNGYMALDELLDSIKAIKDEKHIAGLDITGTDGSDHMKENFFTIAFIVNEVTGTYSRDELSHKLEKNYF